MFYPKSIRSSIHTFRMPRVLQKGGGLSTNSVPVDLYSNSKTMEDAFEDASYVKEARGIVLCKQGSHKSVRNVKANLYAVEGKFKL